MTKKERNEILKWACSLSDEQLIEEYRKWEEGGMLSIDVNPITYKGVINNECKK